MRFKALSAFRFSGGLFHGGAALERAESRAAYSCDTHRWILMHVFYVFMILSSHVCINTYAHCSLCALFSIERVLIRWRDGKQYAAGSPG